MVVVNSKALLPFLPVPPPPPPPGNTLLTNRSPGKFCFSKGHYLSSSEQLAGCMRTKFQGIIPHIKLTREAPPSFLFYLIISFLRMQPYGVYGVFDDRAAPWVTC